MCAFKKIFLYVVIMFFGSGTACYADYIVQTVSWGDGVRTSKETYYKTDSEENERQNAQPVINNYYTAPGYSSEYSYSYGSPYGSYVVTRPIIYIGGYRPPHHHHRPPHHHHGSIDNHISCFPPSQKNVSASVVNNRNNSKFVPTPGVYYSPGNKQVFGP